MADDLVLSNNLDGKNRAVIEGVAPQIDGGRFPIKRTIGDQVVVEADIFADGHEALSAVVKYRHNQDATWSLTPLVLFDNDRWRGQFAVSRIGLYYYVIEAWMDRFKSWRQDLLKRVKAEQDISVELIVGAQIIENRAAAIPGDDGPRLRAWAAELKGGNQDTLAQRTQRALDEPLAALMNRHAAPPVTRTASPELRVMVEPLRARFSAWYEMFPRSCPGRAAAHGTFKDVERQLPRLAQLGFDVLYFPPIHPIGRSFRKGKNNSAVCKPGDPGSPWGIGAAEGGHKSIHPELGSLEDFRHLVQAARAMNLELALDIAFQCSPDHPYVKEHPEWFRKRPDGSIQYAENPPKKYQDIYPFDFECEAWPSLWRELKSIFEFWIAQGVTIFRVDNPHTKAFPFWEWCLGELKSQWPELIFLAEAFTRPKVMNRLAKLGFTQSYNYFPWRNSKAELISYFTELAQWPVREFFRSNLWTNTPDILTEYLQFGGKPAFMARLILAATLGSNYGIYGPAFELCVRQAREPSSEEYLDSEKYEIKNWDLSNPENLADVIAQVNRLRRENAALQGNARLTFHAVDNDSLIAYGQTSSDLTNVILTVVNLDPRHVQSGWLALTLGALGLGPEASFEVHDLLTEEHSLWHGARNFVELDPTRVPAAILRVAGRPHAEYEFDYFL